MRRERNREREKKKEWEGMREEKKSGKERKRKSGRERERAQGKVSSAIDFQHMPIAATWHSHSTGPPESLNLSTMIR